MAKNTTAQKPAAKKAAAKPKAPALSCSECLVAACRGKNEERYPAFCLTQKTTKALLKEVLNLYKDEGRDEGEISRVSACIEGEFYGRLTRVEETLLFIERMGYKKIGIATCVGLLRETATFCKILKARGIAYHAVGCKVGAVDKSEVGVPEDKKLNGGCGHESMCNPVLQAKTLAKWGSDFNIVIGLCVGHDTLFLKHSEAPTTVLIVKDRVMGHNPAAALYQVGGMYSRFKSDVPSY